MTTIRVRSGGDYTSLEAAVSGEQRDVVSPGECVTFEVGDGGGGGDVQVVGWGTTAAHPITVRGVVMRPSWDTSRYRIQS